MIKSMTGYGKAIAETVQKKITIEIKSLNSKQLDLNTRLPWLYKEKELEIRNLLSQKLDRGKIDLSINFDNLDEEFIPVINKTTFKNYYNQLSEIAGELQVKLRRPVSIEEAMKEVDEDMKKHPLRFDNSRGWNSLSVEEMFRPFTI